MNIRRRYVLSVICAFVIGLGLNSTVFADPVQPVQLDKHGLIPPVMAEFKESIPYVYNIFNKKKRLREIDAYWKQREVDLALRVKGCQDLPEKDQAAQCYEQVRVIENRLTQSRVRTGQNQVESLNSQRSSQSHCRPNGSGGYTCTTF